MGYYKKKYHEEYVPTKEDWDEYGEWWAAEEERRKNEMIAALEQEEMSETESKE